MNDVANQQDTGGVSGTIGASTETAPGGRANDRCSEGLAHPIGPEGLAPMVPRTPPSATRHGAFRWICAACYMPIADGYGALVMPWTCISTGGTGGRWHPWHYTCQDASGYSVEVSTLRTASDVDSWTRHLASKTWLPSTDWHEVIASQAVA